MKGANLKEVADDLEEIGELLRADPSAAKMLLKILKSGKPHAEILLDLKKAAGDLEELVRNINSLKKTMIKDPERAKKQLRNIRGLLDKYNICEGGDHDKGN